MKGDNNKEIAEIKARLKEIEQQYPRAYNYEIMGKIQQMTIMPEEVQAEYIRLNKRLTQLSDPNRQT